MKQQPGKAVHPIANDSDSGWHLFGELELPIGMDTHSTVNAWLLKTLAPLNLHTDFLHKVLKSAEDAAVRAMQTEAVLNRQHTYILIYIPACRPMNVQTWGFFRIEKVGMAAKNEDSPDHSVEFYLYLEGQ